MSKKSKWTLDTLKDGLDHYFKTYGHYPTSREVDDFNFLPSSRSIQRRFGGMIELRKQLKLKSSSDLRTGEYSSSRAKKINERAHKIEKEVYDYLAQLFGIEFVHREYFFTDDRRIRTDFFIYHKDGNFSVDVFFAEDRYNFTGCLNSKMNTYKNLPHIEYPVIFLHMNDNISNEEIERILNNKKNKLLKYQKVMTFSTFKEFCKPIKRAERSA